MPALVHAESTHAGVAFSQKRGNASVCGDLACALFVQRGVVTINDRKDKNMVLSDHAEHAHDSFYYRTLDFRKVNACILLGVIVLVVLLLLG